MGNPATDKKSGARNIMTQLLSPVMLDNMRNQVNECVANADNEDKLTELRQSSVQQLQEATLNVIPPDLKKYWSAYVATVHQVGVAQARKPLPKHPFWFKKEKVGDVVDDDEDVNVVETATFAAQTTSEAAVEATTVAAEQPAAVASEGATEAAAVTGGAQSDMDMDVDMHVGGEFDYDEDEGCASEYQVAYGAEDLLSSAEGKGAAASRDDDPPPDIESNKFDVNMHVQVKTYGGKFEYGIIREAHGNGTFNVDYIDDNKVDCAFGVEISSLKHTTFPDNVIFPKQVMEAEMEEEVREEDLVEEVKVEDWEEETTDNKRKTIASTHSHDEADDFDQLKTTDSQNATKPAETIDNNSTPMLETKSRKTMITDHPWYSVDSFKHVKSKMRKITKNKIKKGEHVIVHVHSKNIIKVGWAIDGPFGKEKKNKDKQFEMCYYSVMDEPQDYHAWFLPDKDGERGSMLDDLNPNDVDCYWCPAAILKQAKAEDEKVAALYAL